MGKGPIHSNSGDLDGPIADGEADLNRRGGKLPAGDLIQYWCAVAVSEELYFARAARRLHLDQSTVSRHIQRLEAKLGFQLFIRTSRGVELSEAGKIFLPYARKALLSAGQGERIAQAIARGAARELELAYSPLVDMHLVAQIKRLVDGARLRVPIRFQSVASERLQERLMNGASHAAIDILPVPDHLANLCVRREKLFVALPAAHGLGQRRMIHAVELGDDPVIWMFGTQDSVSSKHLKALFQRVGYAPHFSREVQSVAEALGLVREGFGVAIVKESELRLNPDGIVLRPFVEPELAVETGLLYLPDYRWEFLGELVALVSRNLRCDE